VGQNYATQYGEATVMDACIRLFGFRFYIRLAEGKKQAVFNRKTKGLAQPCIISIAWVCFDIRLYSGGSKAIAKISTEMGDHTIYQAIITIKSSASAMP
jgi:hypothetical protein